MPPNPADPSIGPPSTTPLSPTRGPRPTFENGDFWVRKIVLGKRQVSQIALGKANCFLGGFRSSGALQPSDGC